MVDDDGVVHLQGCNCPSELTDGVKSNCKNCGELYFEAVQGGNGCTKCGCKAVSNVQQSKHCPTWQREIVDEHGVGKRSWNLMREVWTRKTSKATAGTQIKASKELEGEVTYWLDSGGEAETRPRYSSIPLGFTIKCLQNLDTWVPIGRLK